MPLPHPRARTNLTDHRFSYYPDTGYWNDNTYGSCIRDVCDSYFGSETQYPWTSVTFLTDACLASVVRHIALSERI